MKTPSAQFIVPNTLNELNRLRSVLREYAEALQIDLSFQGFEAELAALPGEYASPRGALLMDTVGQEPAGCCARRALDAADYRNACEMTRL